MQTETRREKAERLARQAIKTAQSLKNAKVPGVIVPTLNEAIAEELRYLPENIIQLKSTNINNAIRNKINRETAANISAKAAAKAVANAAAANAAAAKAAENAAAKVAAANKRRFIGGRRTKKHHKKSHKKSRRSHRHRSA